MEIEPQGDGEYPFVGETGEGDMRSTEPHGVAEFGSDGIDYVLVRNDTYQLLIKALLAYDEVQRSREVV